MSNVSFKKSWIVYAPGDGKQITTLITESGNELITESGNTLYEGKPGINENLVMNSNRAGATNFPGWVNNGSTSLIETYENGIHWSGNISNTKNIPSVTTNYAVACTFNQSYVYSMDLKIDKDVRLSVSTPVHYWVGARNTNDIFNTSCNGNLTNRSVQALTTYNITIPANTWFTQRYLITFGSGPTSDGYIYPAIRCFIYGGVLPESYTGAVNGWMKNCKIEANNVATPWTMNPGDWGYIDNTQHGFAEYGDKMSIYNSYIYANEFIEY